MTDAVTKAMRQAEENELALARIEAKKETDKARWEHRTERIPMTATIAGAIILAVVILAVIFLGWQASRGLSSEQKIEREARQLCMEAGGTFIPKIGEAAANLCIGPNHEQVKRP